MIFVLTSSENVLTRLEIVLIISEFGDILEDNRGFIDHGYTRQFIQKSGSFIAIISIGSCLESIRGVFDDIGSGKNGQTGVSRERNNHIKCMYKVG